MHKLRTIPVQFPLLIALIFCFTAICSICFPFAHSDDYPRLLLHPLRLVSLTQSDLWYAGRALSAIAVHTGFSLINDLANLLWLRLTAYAGWLLSAILLTNTLTRIHGKTFPASASLAILATPAMATCIFWASAFPYPWSTLAALLSGYLSINILTKSSGTAARILKTVGSLFLLLISQLIYQPFSFFFLLPWLATTLTQPGRSLKAFLLPPVILSISSIAYFAGFQYWKAFGTLHHQMERAEIELSIPNLYSEWSDWIIRDSMAGWLAFTPSVLWLLAPIALLLATVWILIQQPGTTARIQSILSITFCYFSVWIPIGIIQDPVKGFRLVAPAQSFSILIIFLALYRFPKPGTTLTKVFSTGIIILCLTASYIGIVQPQHREWQLHLNYIQNNIHSLERQNVYIQSIRRHIPSSFSRHEFGFISSSVPWTPESILQLAVLKNQNIPLQQTSLQQIRKYTFIPAYPYQLFPRDIIPVIDSYTLLWNRPSPAPHTFRFANWPNPPQLTAHDSEGNIVYMLNDNWKYRQDIGFYRD